MAYSEQSKKLIKPVYGKEIFDRLEILLRERPFFFQLHGDIAAEKTWVFTAEDLAEIANSDERRRFLDSVFFTTTVVFLGISPEDVSVSGRLMAMKRDGVSTAPHYWITPDTHNRKRDWAEENGIQQIVYPSALGHETCVDKILDFIESFQSLDENIDRPAIAVRGANVLERDPVRLATLDNIDDIRQSLNGIVLESKDEKGRVPFEKYSEICRTYRRAVAQAYLPPKDSTEKWFGHTLEGGPIGGKTFGTVYAAHAPAGEIVAVKILQEKRYRDAAYLSSFRRGAEALNILNQYSVSGVAKLRESYEFPPTLIMEFEPGASLNDVVPANKLNIDGVLAVIRRCAITVRTGHSLPHTVMHRDIRPSNILLKNFSWDDGSYDDVVMFDFDLGWFKGAYGEEATRTDPESLGFQAPEQLATGGVAFRRSTLVDSFGLGMTLYFCVARVIPSAGAAGAEDWKRRVDGACQRAFASDRVAEKRCARLIMNCTNYEQKERPDFSLIVDALDDLISWRKQDVASCSTEFIAEALVAMATDGDYEWDRGRETASYTYQSGISIRTKYDGIKNLLVFEFSLRDPTVVSRRALDQKLSELKPFLEKERSRLNYAETNFHFGETRQFDGMIAWQPDYARRHVKEIGNFTRTIGRWLAAL
jgi:serine/threonine protein kinase